MTLFGAIFTPFYVTYAQSLQQTFIFAGMSLALYTILTGILIFFLGKIERKFSDKRDLVAIGYAVRGFGFIIIGLSFNTTLLVLSLIVLAIGTAMSMPAFDALYSKRVDRDDSSVQWANLQASNFVVAGLAALLGTLLIQGFGFSEIFIGLGILTFLVSFFVHRFDFLN